MFVSKIQNPEKRFFNQELMKSGIGFREESHDIPGYYLFDIPGSEKDI
jgi:hypothetical protein